MRLSVVILGLVGLIFGGEAFGIDNPNRECRSSQQTQAKVALEESATTRRNILSQSLLGFSILFTSPNPSNAIKNKSYSANARNMERLNVGDASGGSVYDNNPSTARGRNRRAMTGCKIPSAREEAAFRASIPKLSEKDCNVQVMDSGPDFMLEAMRSLECPTCPYGVNPKR